MSALFNLKSLIIAVLLTVCTCTYLKTTFPSLINHKNEGFYAMLGKFALVGERLSGYVAFGCFLAALSALLIR